IARIVDHLWDTTKRIDIVYICSNASIARQNINRLNITEAREVALPSRITLLPTVIRDLDDHKLNLVSLTPQTSFDLRATLALADERVLLYWLLPDDWKSSATAARNVLQGSVERDRFYARVSSYSVKAIDQSLHARFVERLRANAQLKGDWQAACE